MTSAERERTLRVLVARNKYARGRFVQGFFGLTDLWMCRLTKPLRIRLVHQEQEEQVAAAAAGQQPLGNAAGRGVQGGGGADV